MFQQILTSHHFLVSCGFVVPGSDPGSSGVGRAISCACNGANSTGPVLWPPGCCILHLPGSPCLLLAGLPAPQTVLPR